MKLRTFALALLSLLLLGSVSTSYTGPGNRTNLTMNIVWRTTCYSTQYPGFPPVWRYRTWDNVYTPAGSAQALTWQALYPETPDGTACYAGLEGSHGWGYGTINNASYPPVSITPSLNCATPGNNGWCLDGLTLHLAATEPIPGQTVHWFESTAGILCDPADAASVACSQVISQSGDRSASVWAVSSFGDTSLIATYTWRLDADLPLITIAAPEPDGQNGWYLTAPTLSLSASDATSGLDSAAFESGDNTATITADGITTLVATSQDVAGNAATQTVTIRKDSLPPAIAIPTFPDGNHGWYVTHPTLTLTASDATSGLATASFDGGGDAITLLEEGVFVLNATATDNAGNARAVAATVQVDTLPPLLAPVLSATSGTNGWLTSNVTIAANASDATSGLALIEYRLDGGSWQSGSMVTVADEGEHTVEFRATDIAGNQASSQPTQFRLDLTPPSSAFSNPPEGATAKISGIFTFSGASLDALSGLAAAEISLDNSLTWQPLALTAGNWAYTWDTRALPDGTYTILVHADDQAGNRENTARVQVVISNQPPRVEIQDSWWLWEVGRLRVRAMDIPVQSITVRVSCSPYHQDVILHYTAETVPPEIQWDRHCGEGAYATESGDYLVTVTACDAWERCASDSGVIKVPFSAPPMPTNTPTAWPTATAQPLPTTQRRQPSPIPTATSVVLPTPTPPAPVELPPAPAAWPWTWLALPGLWLVFSLNSLLDPRPAALRRLGQTWKKVSNHARG